VRTWFVRLAREWPWGIAIVAILSLFFIPRVVHFGSFVPTGQRQELDALRREVEAGDAAQAEARLVSFLSRNSRSPLRIEANLLLARATLARGRAGQYPGSEGLTRAWSILMKAPADLEHLALRREAASQMEEYGLVREAIVRFGILFGDRRDPEIALDLARALVKRGILEPELRQALLDEAATRVSDALRIATAGLRVQAIRMQARILREAGRDEELEALLAVELAETKAPADRGLLQLERGRIFARRNRNMEALACFDEAERLIVDPLQRGMAQVYQAELFIRAENVEGVEFCKRVQFSDSPAAPFARIVLGAAGLKSRTADSLEALQDGWSRIRRPRVIDDAGFDPGGVMSALRGAAEKESDPDRLIRFAGVFGEVGRLRPLSTRIGFEQAALLLRAHRYEEAAERFLATGNIERAEPEAKEKGFLAAADACAEGGLYRRAATLYRGYYELRTAANTAGLFFRASSLKKAGDLPGAIAGFDEYVSRAGASGTLTGTALVEKAALQAAGGAWDAALATYDRVLKARDVATSPLKDDWALALLGRGRALLNLSRPAEARKVLEEYLERYAEGPVPSAASLDAAWLLVRVAIEERQWKAGLERLRLLEGFASRLTDADRVPYKDLLQDARFTAGDLLFNLGDFAAAAFAYQEAARRTGAPEDRLWGLIGRARSLARLEKIDEARREYASARALLDETRSSPPGSRSREYWEIAMEELSREVR